MPLRDRRNAPGNMSPLVSRAISHTATSRSYIQMHHQTTMSSASPPSERKRFPGRLSRSTGVPSKSSRRLRLLKLLGKVVIASHSRKSTSSKLVGRPMSSHRFVSCLQPLKSRRSKLLRLPNPFHELCIWLQPIRYKSCKQVKLPKPSGKLVIRLQFTKDRCVKLLRLLKLFGKHISFVQLLNTVFASCRDHQCCQASAQVDSHRGSAR